MKFKDFLIAVVVLAFAGYSTWKGMQTIASVSILLFVVVLYKHQIQQLRDIVFGILKDAKQAKVGQLEFQIGKDNLGHLLKENSAYSAFSQIFLQGLEVEDVGLLNEISKTEKYLPKGAIKDRLRGLRAKGLIDHNQTTMAESTEVWLTETGKRLVEEINKNK